MTMFRITITKIESNPEYDAEEAKNRRGRSYGEPYNVSSTIETEALRCDLGEEQFEAVRKACLEKM